MRCCRRRLSFGITGLRRSGTTTCRLDADRTVDLGDLPLLPGLVDSHVHVNEPGRTEWEGFATATRAAARGRGHDDRRHAAQLDPAHHHGRRAAGQARRGRRQVRRRRGVLGRGGAGQPRRARRAARRRASRVQVLPHRLGRRRVRAARPRASCEAAMAAARGVGRGDDRARGGPVAMRDARRPARPTTRSSRRGRRSRSGGRSRP